MNGGCKVLKPNLLKKNFLHQLQALVLLVRVRQLNTFKHLSQEELQDIGAILISSLKI